MLIPPPPPSPLKPLQLHHQPGPIASRMVQLPLMRIQPCQAPVTELEEIYHLLCEKLYGQQRLFAGPSRALDRRPFSPAIQGFWPLGQAALWTAASLGDMSSLARYSQRLGRR